MSGPVKTIRDKGLQIAIWETQNGGYSFSISKTYKCKKTDQWKDSKYYYKEDLQKLGDMIQLAVGYASDRATHQVEAIASPKQESQFSSFEDDDIPF